MQTASSTLARRIMQTAVSTVRTIAMSGGLLLIAGAASASTPQPFSPWINGTTVGEPETQVQRIDGDTFVIRQSVRTNFEAPFLYLIFGKSRALLIDTGAGGFKVRPTIDRLIEQWRLAHAGVPVSLLVAHSHGHGDHHAGDDEFRGRPDTQIVGLTPQAVSASFNIARRPQDIGHLDLGDRMLDIIPTPGHEPAHIMVYDGRTRLLFSGDMLYPGRLYVPTDQFATFRASTDRLAAFARTHPIRALLGAHIEMTNTPGKDYEREAAAHPAEHALALSPATIAELQRAAHAEPAVPVIDRHADFILYPVPPRPAG